MGQLYFHGEGWCQNFRRSSLRNRVFRILRQESIILCLYVENHIYYKIKSIIICSLSLSLHSVFQLVLSWMFFFEKLGDWHMKSHHKCFHFSHFLLYDYHGTVVCVHFFYGPLSIILDSSLGIQNGWKILLLWAFVSFCFDKTFVRFHFTGLYA